MEQFELTAELREDVGKGASRRLRRAGKLPGIVYGSKKDVTPITLGQYDVIHRLEHEAFFSHILTLKIGKKKEKVVLKNLQRHPFKSTLLHVDLQRISEDEKLTMRIPLHYINEDKCMGVKTGGGVISHVMTDIEISCLPGNLPEFIEVDMLEVEIGTTIHLGDLKLPEDVDNYSLLHGGNADQSVVTVHLPKVEVEEEEGEEGEEGEELEEGAVVAPADEVSDQDQGSEDQ